MSEDERGRGRPSGELTGKDNTNQKKQGGERQVTPPSTPHERLVKELQRYIKEQQQALHKIPLPEGRESWPQEEIIRNRLSEQTGAKNEQESDFYSKLRFAWDALVYDRYPTGSLTERLAGSTMWGYYQATHEPTIKLTDPVQIRMIDAMTEAVGLPHQKGQAEIEIPEKLRHWNKWTASQEYLDRWQQAQAKRRK